MLLSPIILAVLASARTALGGATVFNGDDLIAAVNADGDIYLGERASGDFAHFAALDIHTAFPAYNVVVTTFGWLAVGPNKDKVIQGDYRYRATWYHLIVFPEKGVLFAVDDGGACASGCADRFGVWAFDTCTRADNDLSC